MTTTTARVRLMPNGRVSIPAAMRKRHGLEPGREVVFEDNGETIVIRSASSALADIQRQIREQSRSDYSVDDFLAERGGLWGD